jgi:hypothetical protein
MPRAAFQKEQKRGRECWLDQKMNAWVLLPATMMSGAEHGGVNVEMWQALYGVDQSLV